MRTGSGGFKPNEYMIDTSKTTFLLPKEKESVYIYANDFLANLISTSQKSNGALAGGIYIPSEHFKGQQTGNKFKTPTTFSQEELETFQKQLEIDKDLIEKAKKYPCQRTTYHYYGEECIGTTYKGTAVIFEFDRSSADKDPLCLEVEYLKDEAENTRVFCRIYDENSEISQDFIQVGDKTTYTLLFMTFNTAAIGIR